MSGRHAGWRRLLGDTAERPELLDFGKKLLAYLENQRALSGVQTLSIKRELEDGSVVMARLVGGLPEIYVRAAPEGEGEAPAPKIACNPRNSEFPSGRDPLWMQVGLTPRAGAWGAWFGSRLAGELVAPPKALYTRAFPDGIKRGGNCDWRGADGVVVSFYGPTLRYLYDPYRKPDKQYGRWVFMNGDAVLDVAEYDTDNSLTTPENLVLGAALVGTTLYVMQARINDFAADPSAEFPGVPGWVSPVYPPGTTDLKLFKYSVTRIPTKAQKGARAKVNNGSRELLWSKTDRGYVNPWVANPTATVWETFAMPDETREVVVKTYPGPTTSTICWPSASSKHTRLDIGTGVSETTTDVSDVLDGYLWEPSAGNAEYVHAAVFAADYDAQGNRIEAAIVRRATLVAGVFDPRQVDATYLRIGNVEHLMTSLGNDGIPSGYDDAHLVSIDIRNSAAVIAFAHAEWYTQPGSNDNTWTWKCIVNNSEVHAADTNCIAGHVQGLGNVRSDQNLFSRQTPTGKYAVGAVIYTTGEKATLAHTPISPIVWAYRAFAGTGINLEDEFGDLYSKTEFRLHNQSAMSPILMPNAELSLWAKGVNTPPNNFTTASGWPPSIVTTFADNDGRYTPVSFVSDEKGNWLFSALVGLPYAFRISDYVFDFRLSFPTLYAGSTDLPARTGIGPEASGEPTNTYGPMWLFGKY